MEVTRVRDAANARAAAGLTGGLPGLPGGLTGGLALESMVRQVQQLFPQMPHSVLAADLAMTRSPDMTIDNILEGRLIAPPAPPSPPAVVVAERLNGELEMLYVYYYVGVRCVILAFTLCSNIFSLIISSLIFTIITHFK